MTRIVGENGVSVATIEHLMAALAGCGIHDALVRIDGPEVPILDGSAAPFVAAIRAAGVIRRPGPLMVWRLRRPVEVSRGGAVARLSPAAGPAIDFEIDFPDAAIGRQSKRLVLAGEAFRRELADARTFCREADILDMQAAGRALGGSYDNAVVVDGARVLSPGGWRRRDEAVRHKMLDALGDLALAGAPILGRYTGVRAGHALTNALLHKLFSTPGAVDLVACPVDVLQRLPHLPAVAARVRAVA
jgi:UDP-3-O-[3-hydroxymyristoyl] N-acetylglucosamine deacetylase